MTDRPVTDGPATDRPVTDRVRNARRGRLAVALGLLVVIVIVEVAAGPALTPAHEPQHEAQVLAVPGLSHMVQGAHIDPTEITQVAASQHQPPPLAPPAQALLDGLLLIGAAAVAWPHFRPRRRVARQSRAGSFVGSLAILLVGIAVAVVAIARLRFLVALYLSPPFGTLSYLLLYGSWPRSASLLVLILVMALKVAACSLFSGAVPRAAGERGMTGLALTSVAATVLVTFGYALAPASLASIVDALVAAIVALVAALWAGVIVSGSVRRLA